jgi:hypothetical protein
VYQINSSVLLGEGSDSLLPTSSLAGKLLVHLEDVRKHQVAGMSAVDSGCRGWELDLVLTERKAESLGLRPFERPGRAPRGAASSRSQLQPHATGQDLAAGHYAGASVPPWHRGSCCIA